jgi:hypothetical protein
VLVSRPKKYFATKYPPLFRQWIWKALQRKCLYYEACGLKEPDFVSLRDLPDYESDA